MMDNKNIPDADQSWASAEKMLDRHFRKRKLLIWFLSFLIPAMIVGFFMIKNQVNNVSETNIVSSENELVSVSSAIKKSEINNAGFGLDWCFRHESFLVLSFSTVSMYDTSKGDCNSRCCLWSCNLFVWETKISCET